MRRSIVEPSLSGLGGFMTDIVSTTPITIRRPGLPRLELPKLGIGVAIEALAKAMGQALDMAYMTPYRTTRPPTPAAFDADLQGRDPNW